MIRITPEDLIDLHNQAEQVIHHDQQEWRNMNPGEVVIAKTLQNMSYDIRFFRLLLEKVIKKYEPESKV